MKKIAAILALGLLAAALAVPSTAQAATAAGVGTCSTDLPQWPSTAPQGAPDCEGTVIGAGLSGTTPIVCVPGCGFRATVAQYNEPCIAVGTLNEPPLVGFANGELFADPGSGDVNIGGYSWTRVGLVAIILPTQADDAAGVAAFVPEIPLGTCQVPASDFTVTVAGLVASAL